MTSYQTKFTNLRHLMDLHGERNKAMKLVAIVGRSKSFWEQRLAGNQPWSLEDCYKVLDYYGVPHDKLNHYFPQGGISKMEGVA